MEESIGAAYPGHGFAVGNGLFGRAPKKCGLDILQVSI
jgi:hypothetical protein